MWLEASFTVQSDACYSLPYSTLLLVQYEALIVSPSAIAFHGTVHFQSDHSGSICLHTDDSVRGVPILSVPCVDVRIKHKAGVALSGVDFDYTKLYLGSTSVAISLVRTAALFRGALCSVPGSPQPPCLPWRCIFGLSYSSLAALRPRFRYTSATRCDSASIVQCTTCKSMQKHSDLVRVFEFFFPSRPPDSASAAEVMSREAVASAVAPPRNKQSGPSISGLHQPLRS